MPKDPEIITQMRYYDRADGVHYVLLFQWERPEERWTPFRSVVMARHDADGGWRLRVVPWNSPAETYRMSGLEQAMEQFMGIATSMIENRYTYVRGDGVCQNGWDL